MPLTLACCYWLLSKDEREPKDKRPAHRAAAAGEFQKEITRVKAQPVPQHAKAELVREQDLPTGRLKARASRQARQCQVASTR